MCGYNNYPIYSVYPDNQNNNCWTILIVIIIIFFLFWGFNRNNR